MSMSLVMMLKFLPPGFRFHPTDVELVLYYLKRKIIGKKLHYDPIAEVDIYKFSPWDLPEMSCLESKDYEWFFYCPRERKYACGSRIKRATENGYWKSTGKDRFIRYNNQTIGTVKTLVFHLGHAPRGERTDWVLHEYMILDEKLAAIQDTYVLCKVFKKNGLGPKNSAHHGIPFNEADWSDDDAAENHSISVASNVPALTIPMQTEAETFVRGPILFSEGSSGSFFVAQDPSPSAGGTSSEVVKDDIGNDIVGLLASFTDEDVLLSNENVTKQGCLIGDIGNDPLPCSDDHTIYNGLCDLDNCGLANKSLLDFPVLPYDDYSVNNMSFKGNATYIEQKDFLSPLDCFNGVALTDLSMLKNDEYYLNTMPSQENSKYIDFSDLRSPLSCSNGGDTTHQLSTNEIFGTGWYENHQQLSSITSSSSTCQCGLPVPQEGSYEGNECADLFHMGGHQV